MYYIIFDLEWNGAYSYYNKSFLNEIIEIGAVKIDRNLNIADTYKRMIFPRYTKKLSGRCKKITGITNAELKSEGIGFIEAFDEFSKWAGGDDNIFMSWSNSDLFVMSRNFTQYTGNPRVEFIKNYCDAQEYCMSFINKKDNPNGNQISLEHCAELFDIDVDTEKLHRALADCYVTASCFKKVFDENEFKKYVKHCDSKFFERLIFKPYYITKETYGDFNVHNVELSCPNCKSSLDSPEKFTLVNKAFKGASKCDCCNKTYWVFIRAKKLYDDYAVKIGYVEMNKKKARRMNYAKNKKNVSKNIK